MIPKEYTTKANATYKKGGLSISENIQYDVQTDIYIPMPPVSSRTATVHITAIIKGEAPVISPC